MDLSGRASARRRNSSGGFGAAVVRTATGNSLAMDGSSFHQAGAAAVYGAAAWRKALPFFAQQAPQLPSGEFQIRARFGAPVMGYQAAGNGAGQELVDGLPR